MVQNLFSVLNQAQLDSLTKEERTMLMRLDEKLFPDYDKYVDLHMESKSIAERVIERHKAADEANSSYARELESSFC